MHTCPRCGYTTELIYNFKKHLQIKKPCLPKVADVSLDHLKEQMLKKKEACTFECEICKNQYASSDSLRVHSKKCRDKNPEYEYELDNIKNTISTLMTKVASLEADKQNIVIGAVNTQNNINISLGSSTPISSFLRENVEYLDDEYFMTCAKRLDTGLIDLIRNIRFNPQHPENMNVRMHRIKQKTLCVFKNNRWEICDAKWTLEEMIVHGARILYQKMLTNVDQEKLIDGDSLESKINNWLLNILPKTNEKIMGNLSRRIYAMILNNHLLVMEDGNDEVIPV